MMYTLKVCICNHSSKYNNLFLNQINLKKHWFICSQKTLIYRNVLIEQGRFSSGTYRSLDVRTILRIDNLFLTRIMADLAPQGDPNVSASKLGGLRFSLNVGRGKSGIYLPETTVV